LKVKDCQGIFNFVIEKFELIEICASPMSALLEKGDQSVAKSRLPGRGWAGFSEKGMNGIAVPGRCRGCKNAYCWQKYTAAVLNLWFADHWWSVAFCLVVREQSMIIFLYSR
jgi:hypothetical protein